MTESLTLVIYMAIITWVTIFAASLMRVKGWTFAGTKLALGNRDVLPDASPMAGRADRTARNTLENFILFAVIALVVHVAGAQSPRVDMGAEVFFWSRILFIPVYYAGIVYLRTVVWVVSLIGLGMMLSALW
jgi:uncharacterized MAPEG superfamily protein